MVVPLSKVTKDYKLEMGGVYDMNTNKAVYKILIINCSWLSTDFLDTIIIFCFTSSNLAFKNTLGLYYFLIVHGSSSCLEMAYL